MGIRVDTEALTRQLAITDDEDRMSLEWHQALIKDQMPQTIGGGIGQSRLVMLLLQKSILAKFNVVYGRQKVMQLLRICCNYLQ